MVRSYLVYIFYKNEICIDFVILFGECFRCDLSIYMNYVFVL